jgi:hypothetical protein
MKRLIVLAIVLVGCFDLFGQNFGIEITKKEIMMKINNLNKVLEKEDTSVVKRDDCIEIIRIRNSIRIYGVEYWAGSQKDSISIGRFFEKINNSSDFNRTLFDLIFNLGEGETSSGMGIYYKSFNLYSGGKISNENSFYKRKKRAKKF